MGGFDSKRLVLIHSIVKDAGKEKHIFGTGYFVTNKLVLTASHVLSAGPPEKIEVRPTVPHGAASSSWIEALKVPAWENIKLDAALIEVTQPLEDLEPPNWGAMDFKQNETWTSVAYPKASSQTIEGLTEFKTSGLQGILYAHGGGGQGIRELELGVEHEAELWNGISGAPVFVEGKLVGIIKTSLTSYEQKRLAAVPVSLLLRDPGFRTTIAQKWLQPFPQTTWILILLSENGNSELAERVQAAIHKQSEEIKRLTGQVINDKPFVVNVTEALESPERMFQFVQAIAAAPIMVVDVTEFQPAVMLFLGIRSVVRRGVTITTINEAPDEASLSQLPFNIQETKVIHLSGQYDIDSPKHSVNWIGSAISSGLMQLRNDPSYLDLPVYDAIRSPEPKSLAGTQSIRDRILMLCPFKEAYQEHWRYVSDKITINISSIETSLKSLERMLDISSPRLVGQALYEGIRWSRCCIVDWTNWRANVFFELGVRYSCSDIGPICLIEADDCKDDKSTFPLQRERLLALLNPIVYKLNGPPEPFKKAFARYAAIINGQEIPLEHMAVAHNAIYETIVNSYYWAQEPITRLPHEEMRNNLQAKFGKDPQKKGSFPILFSTNPEFARELGGNLQERWIAAWAYLRSRYSPDEFTSNPELRQELVALGEEVVQTLSKSSDPNHKRISEGIVDLIDELETL